MSAINALDGAFVAMPIALVLTGYDFDHDGVISREELDRGADMEWGRMNPDGMAAISLIELARWSETSLGSAMARPGHLAFDQNGSGTIDKSELRQLLLREYANADRDGDGRLTRAELVRQLNLPRGGQRGEAGGRPPGGGAPPGGGRPR